MAALLAVLWQPVSPALARQLTAPAATPAQSTPAVEDPEARGRGAPVLVGGEPIIWVSTGAGPYTPQFRANRIGQRLQEVIRDRSLQDPTVTVAESDSSSELRAGPHLLMGITRSRMREASAPRGPSSRSR